MSVLDCMTKEDIEELITEVFYVVTCEHKATTRSPKEWRATVGNINVPAMCKDIAVVCFVRDWYPAGTEEVREVLKRLSLAGDWTTPQERKV